MYRLKLLIRPIVLSAIISLALIIPLFFDIFPQLKFEYKLWIIGGFFVLNIILGYYDIKSFTLKVNIDTLLGLMIKSVYKDRWPHYRSNVMIYSRIRKNLKIYFSFNMEGHNDRNIVIKPNNEDHIDLSASQAFLTKDPICLICANVPAHNNLVLHHRVWDQMKSVTSIPILNKKGNKVIAILNIDSEYALRTTQFDDTKKCIIFNLYSDIIKNIMG